MELPEEVELGWMHVLTWRDLIGVATVCSRWRRLGRDASLWRPIFEKEFGSDKLATVLAQPAGASLTEIIESLWLAPVGTVAETVKHSYFWDAAMRYYDMTDFYAPGRTEWDLNELIEALQGTTVEPDKKEEAQNEDIPWKQLFAENYKLAHLWLHGCDYRTDKTKVFWQNEARLVRLIVTGNAKSGKTSFLESLSHYLHNLTDAQVEQSRGVNAVALTVKGVRAVLLEVSRPQGWFGNLFCGKVVDGVISIVDSRPFEQLLIDVTTEGEPDHNEGPDIEAQLKSIYAGLHAMTGEAHRGKLALIVCAHQLDLVSHEWERDDIVEWVSQRLRVNDLERCDWYYYASASTVGTSSKDGMSCHTAVEAWLRKWADLIPVNHKKRLEDALDSTFAFLPSDRLSYYMSF